MGESYGGQTISKVVREGSIPSAHANYGKKSLLGGDFLEALPAFGRFGRFGGGGGVAALSGPQDNHFKHLPLYIGMMATGRLAGGRHPYKMNKLGSIPRSPIYILYKCLGGSAGTGMGLRNP